jgi:hypothetical protein
MGWEQHGQRRYFYRPFRLNGKVRRQYIGTGGIGQLADEGDALRTRQKTKERESLALVQAKLQQVDRSLFLLVELSERLLVAGLLTAGFFRPSRHHWRPRRANQAAR